MVVEGKGDRLVDCFSPRPANKVWAEESRIMPVEMRELVCCACQLRMIQSGFAALTTRHLERLAIEVQTANDFLLFGFLIWRDGGE